MILFETFSGRRLSAGNYLLTLNQIILISFLYNPTQSRENNNGTTYCNAKGCDLTITTQFNIISNDDDTVNI